MMVSKTTRDLFHEIPVLFAGRSENHRRSVRKTFEMFFNGVEPPEHLVNITPAHIDRFKMILMSRVSPMTVNKYLRNLRAVFGRAVKRGYLARNPVSMIEFVSVQDPAPKEISFAEFARFFLACETPEDVLFFRVLAVTGMRVGELAVRKWEDFDLERRRLTITGTKTGKARVAFLGKHSLHLMLGHRMAMGCPRRGPIFPPLTKQPCEKWSRRCAAICARADLDRYRAKDFRASYLPRGLELGKRFDVGDFGLGHKPHGIGARHYNRIDPSLVRDYNEALDEALENACRTEKIKSCDDLVTPPAQYGHKTRLARKSKRPASA